MVIERSVTVTTGSFILV